MSKKFGNIVVQQTHNCVTFTETLGHIVLTRINPFASEDEAKKAFEEVTENEAEGEILLTFAELSETANAAVNFLASLEEEEDGAAS